MDTRKLAGVNSSSGSLKGALKYTNIRDRVGSIAKVVKDSAGSLRSGRFNAGSAFGKIKAMEKGMSLEEQKDIRQVLQHLQKSASEAAAKREADFKTPGSNAENKSSSDKSDLEFRDRRAALLRASRAYEQTKNLGSGESAKKMQAQTYSAMKDAEKKMNEADSKSSAVSGSLRTASHNNNQTNDGLSHAANTRRFSL